MGRVIGLISGKGGVGKTTLTVNMGVSLSRLGNDVTLIDSDFSASNLGVYLGQYDHPVKIQNVLRGEAEMDQAVFRHPSGVEAVTASNEIGEEEPNLENLEMVLEEASQGSDYVLVDCPPGMNSTVEKVMESVDELLIVTMPTQTSSLNAAQVIEKAKQLKKPVLGTIVNKTADDPDSELVEREIEMMTESHLLGKVPHDEEMREALFENRPIIDHNPYSEASISIQQLAHDLEGVQYEKPKFAKLKRGIRKIKKNIQN